MMSEKILYLALSISILGLILLIYASEALEPPLSSIEEITTNGLGKNVHVIGNVERVHEFEGGSALLTLGDNNTDIDVYLPYNTAKQIDLKLLDKRVDVIGEVQVYNGRLEIIVDNKDSIRILK